MIYRGKPHERLFNHESRLRPTEDNRFTAALYLLTADSKLWNQVEDAVGIHRICVEDMHPKELGATGYVFFQLAKDILTGSEKVSMSSLVCPAVITPTDFLVICTALCIRGFGTSCSERLLISKENGR